MNRAAVFAKNSKMDELGGYFIWKDQTPGKVIRKKM